MDPRTEAVATNHSGLRGSSYGSSRGGQMLDLISHQVSGGPTQGLAVHEERDYTSGDELLWVQLAVRVAAPLLAGSAAARPRKLGSQPLATVVATLPPSLISVASPRCS